LGFDRYPSLEVHELEELLLEVLFNGKVGLMGEQGLELMYWGEQGHGELELLPPGTGLRLVLLEVLHEQLEDGLDELLEDEEQLQLEDLELLEENKDEKEQKEYNDDDEEIVDDVDLLEELELEHEEMLDNDEL